MNGTIFVKRIDALLQKKGLKRKDISDNCNISTQTISHWSIRGTMPAADYVFLIADYLGVSARWLVTGEEEKTQDSATLSNEERRLLSDIADLTEEQRESVYMMIEGYKQKNASHSERLFG